MKKIKNSAIVLLISITLSFAPSSYADDYSRFSLTGVSAMALTFGAFGILAFLAGKSSATPQGASAPVILSSSNYNLLSINGSTANGKIIVKNSGTGTLKSLRIDGDISPIVVTSNSCITDPPIAGGQCEIGISYTGTAGADSRSDVLVKITTGDGAEANSDLVRINIINIPPNKVYIPSIDETMAKGIGPKVNSFVTINKNGVDFLYASSYGGGVYKSSDNGETWLAINHGLTSKFAIALCLHKNYLYVGVFEYFNPGPGNSGIFRTNDGGATWTPVNTGLSGDGLKIFSLSVHNDTLYAGTYGAGVFKAVETSGGITWENANDSNLTGKRVWTLFSKGQYLYAGTEQDGIFRTNDGGTTWTPINNNLLGAQALSVVSICADDQFLYIGTGDGVYKSEIGTVNWTQMKPLTIPSLQSHVFLSLQNGFLYAMFSYNKILGYSAGGQVYRKDISSDSNPWTLLRVGTMDPYTIYADNNNLLYLGTNVGVQISNDNGTSWKQRGFFSLGPWVTAIYPSLGSKGFVSGKYLFSGTYYLGIFRASDYGANWERITPPGLEEITSPITLNVIYEKDNYLYAPLIGFGIYRSSDQGNTWKLINQGLTPDYVIFSIVADDNGFLYTGDVDSHFFVSTDFGDNWTLITPAFTTSFIASLHLYQSAIYAGTDGDGIYRSFDHGSTWPDHFLLTKTVISFCSNSNFLYAGTDDSTNGIQKSADGATWGPTTPQEVPGPISSLFCNGNNVFASNTNAEIYKSLDQGAHWTQMSGGLFAYFNALYEENNYLYIGDLYTGAVYKVFIQ